MHASLFRQLGARTRLDALVIAYEALAEAYAELFESQLVDAGLEPEPEWSLPR